MAIIASAINNRIVACAVVELKGMHFLPTKNKWGAIFYSFKLIGGIFYNFRNERGAFFAASKTIGGYFSRFQKQQGGHF